MPNPVLFRLCTKLVELLLLRKDSEVGSAKCKAMRKLFYLLHDSYKHFKKKITKIEIPWNNLTHVNIVWLCLSTFKVGTAIAILTILFPPPMTYGLMISNSCNIAYH